MNTPGAIRQHARVKLAFLRGHITLTEFNLLDRLYWGLRDVR